LQTQEALHVSFVRRNQPTFRTSNARTSLYPLLETPIPLHPPSPLPNIPQNRMIRGPRASAVLLFYTDQMNRVHGSEEAPRSFTMAPCVAVERLEGKQWCSRAAVGEHAGKPENNQGDCSRKNERSMKNDQTLQQPITQSRQSGTQTTSAHLHWCEADPPSSMPTHFS